jgi:hypothetical protein
MANEISSFDLEKLSKAYGLRIWQCRRIERRWSFIAGAGEEKILPSHLIFSTADLGFFVQSEASEHPQLVADLKRLLAPEVTC